MAWTIHETEATSGCDAVGETGEHDWRSVTPNMCECRACRTVTTEG